MKQLSIFDYPTKKEISFVDLFAGVGGFRVALESLGWKCVFSNDNDKKCMTTYTTNFGNDGFVLRDIREIGSDGIPDHDVLCGGFPCQPFSPAGLRRGFEDVRGTLFQEIVRILRDKRPKCFILENVEGLTKHDGGRTFDIIINLLSKTVNGQTFFSRYSDCLGYYVFHKILNSKDYGVPQSRKRIFIVGFRKNTKFSFPSKHWDGTVMRDILDHHVDERYKMNIVLEETKNEL